MRLKVISDIHLEFANWDWFPPQDDSFYIIAGDIATSRIMREWFLERFKDRLFYIYGNHDYYGTMFPEPEDDCKIMEVGNIKIAGATLWTDLSNWNDWIDNRNRMADSQYIKFWDYDRYNRAFQYQKKFLLNSEADVIVSHHLPSFQSVHEQYRNENNSSFASDLDEEILAMKKPPKLWIHGHTHTEHDYMLGETRVICHPRGYPNEPLFKNYKLKEIVI